MTKIKICGLTRCEDATLAESLGADYLGMVFYEKSKRLCSILVAHQIFRETSNPKVFVFGYDDHSRIIDIISSFHSLDYYLQLPFDHPSLSIFERKFIPSKIMVSIPVKNKIDGDKLVNFKKFHAIILDTGGQKDESGNFMHGGTGVTFDWSYIKHLKMDYFLAGGLSDKNIEKALNYLSPFGVDVASGLEKKPGIKDRQKLTSLIRQIQENDLE